VGIGLKADNYDFLVNFSSSGGLWLTYRVKCRYFSDQIPSKTSLGEFMKKRTLAGLGLAVALTFSGLAPQAASAYPPGRSLNLAADANMVQYRSNRVHIVVDNVASGRLTFSVNGKVSRYFSPRISGSSQSWYFYPSAPGKFIVTGSSGIESKSTTIYVPKQPPLPRQITVRKGFHMNFQYVAPGSTVSMSINGVRAATGVADANGELTLSVAAGVVTRGANQVYINYGGAFTSGGKIVGLK
jgi:hypothetical protein